MAAVRNEVGKQSRLPFRQDFLGFFGAHFLLQNDASDTEVARFRAPLRVFAEVGRRPLQHASRALGTFADHRVIRRVFRIVFLVSVAEIKFELPFGIKPQRRRKGASQFAREARQGADHAFTQQLFHFRHFKGAPRGVLGQTEIAPLRRTGKPTVVFYNFAAALGAAVTKVCRMFHGHRVAFVAFGGFHNIRRHAADFLHEVVARETPLFDLSEFVFPFPSEFRVGKRRNTETFQQREQLLRLRRRPQVTTVAHHVGLINEVFDDGGARRRRPQAFFRHGVPEFVVRHEFPRSFHCRQKRCFRIPGGRPRFEFFNIYAFRRHSFGAV